MSAATLTRERPILFSAPMVQALLGRWKTQTRRIIKPQPWADSIAPHQAFANEFVPWKYGEPQHSITCPYGAPGDRLWVREAFAPYLRGSPCAIRDASYVVLADGTQVHRDGDISPGLPKYAPGAYDGIRWRPSIRMPRWASRITLEVESVRVERLQDISEADAIADGVERDDFFAGWKGYGGDCWRDTARESFASLWRSINGAESWEANPWAWVVSFKVAEVAR